MTFYHRDPFREFRLIADSIFEEFFNSSSETMDLPNRVLPVKGFPKYDQYNKDDGSVVLEFPLAGYKLSDLSVVVEGEKLVISASKAKQTEGEKKVVSGRTYKSFERVFTADKNLDLENVNASFEDGLLTVVVPQKEKVEKSSLKKIQISSSKLLE